MQACRSGLTFYNFCPLQISYYTILMDGVVECKKLDTKYRFCFSLLPRPLPAPQKKTHVNTIFFSSGFYPSINPSILGRLLFCSFPCHLTSSLHFHNFCLSFFPSPTMFLTRVSFKFLKINFFTFHMFYDTEL